ncbi:MAG: hypothetical protein KAJ93_05550 [Methanosarcinales archaeon]|nr:hypothetical protein [Methanosarcinales archaeon]
MNMRDLSIVLGVILFGYIITAGCIDSNHQQNLTINESQAINITQMNQTTQDYFSDNFINEEWRLVRATLLNETSQNVNNSTYQGEFPVWKVEMMERTCACNSIKKLHVIKGYVSPYTGEVFNVSTGMVLETQYDIQSCASLDCHKNK